MQLSDHKQINSYKLSMDSRKSEDESNFYSYETCVANDEIIEEYFQQIESGDYQKIVEALVELGIIFQEDVISISPAQFYVLLNIIKDAEDAHLKALATKIVYLICKYPEDLIENIVPFDFTACFEEALPNNDLFLIIESFIPVRSGLADYLNEYGFVDRFVDFIGPESEFNSSCLCIMRRLSEKNVFRPAFLELLIAIINETDDDKLRLDAFKTFAVLVGNVDECKVEFLKYIETFIQYIDAFPPLINKVFYIFASAAKSKNPEYIQSLYSEEFVAKIIEILGSDAKIHYLLVFLARSAKQDAFKAYLIENEDLFNAIVNVVSDNSHDYSDNIEVIKLISRVFYVSGANYDVNAFIDSGLFQTVVDFVASSHHGDTNEILKGLVGFVNMAQSQDEEAVMKIYENESLLNALNALNETEINHTRTKENLSSLLDFMQTEIEE